MAVLEQTMTSKISMLSLGALEIDESRLRVIFKKIVAHGADGTVKNNDLVERCRVLLEKPHQLGGFNVGY
ncbi:MAG: hypothetical protein ACTS9Y_00375 [Methylophilus sp.]|uniref:hypothetical protein n=1 Tax=Methylophilus sp. TaxID=29541 RepID=UPI003FA0A6F0